MKNRLIVLAVMIVALFGMSFVVSHPASAVDEVTYDNICAVQPSSSSVGCNDSGSVYVIAQRIIKWLLGIVGMVAVVMIIIGGIRLTTSSGSPEAVKVAKNTILYAVIGLVVSFSGWAVVNYVVEALNKSNTSSKQKPAEQSQNPTTETPTTPDTTTTTPPVAPSSGDPAPPD